MSTYKKHYMKNLNVFSNILRQTLAPIRIILGYEKKSIFQRTHLVLVVGSNNFSSNQHFSWRFEQ